MAISSIGQNNISLDPDNDGDVHKSSGGPGRGLFQNGSIQNVDQAVLQFTNRLSSQLNLTDAQKTSLTALLKKEFTDFNASQKSSGATSVDKNTVQAFFDKLNTDTKGILTSDQAAKFDSILAAMKNHGHHHRDKDSNAISSNLSSTSQVNAPTVQPDGSVDAIV